MIHPIKRLKGPEMTDIIKEFWGMILAGISGIVWMVRLENRNALNTAAIDRLERQRHEDLIAAREARADTSKRLDEIRGDLGEVRDDIKALLRATK